MAKRRIRFILAITVLAVSMTLLIWGLWPLAHLTRVVSIPGGSLIVP